MTFVLAKNWLTDLSQFCRFYFGSQSSEIYGSYNENHIDKWKYLLSCISLGFLYIVLLHPRGTRRMPQENVYGQFRQKLRETFVQVCTLVADLAFLIIWLLEEYFLENFMV